MTMSNFEVVDLSYHFHPLPIIDMRTILVSCICLLIVLPTEQAFSQTEDEKTLRYLKEVEWPKAYREQDVDLLDHILAEEFQMIDASGEWSDKARELEWIKEQ